MNLCKIYREGAPFAFCTVLAEPLLLYRELEWRWTRLTRVKDFGRYSHV